METILAHAKAFSLHLTILSSPQWDAVGVHGRLKLTEIGQGGIFDNTNSRLLE